MAKKKKNEAKAKRHPEAERLLLENYLLSFLSFALFSFPKRIGRIVKKFAKFEII